MGILRIKYFFEYNVKGKSYLCKLIVDRDEYFWMIFGLVVLVVYMLGYGEERYSESSFYSLLVFLSGRSFEF